MNLTSLIVFSVRNSIGPNLGSIADSEFSEQEEQIEPLIEEPAKPVKIKSEKKSDIKGLKKSERKSGLKSKTKSSIHKEDPKEEKLYFWLVTAMIVIAAAISLFSIFYLSPWMAPDEPMRFDVSWWIYEHNRLPWGDEPELISAWGFNYSFSPYFPSIFSVLFMKLAGLFTNNQAMIYCFFRMPSFVATVGSGIFAALIAKFWFERTSLRVLFVAAALFFPSIMYLSGYLNNDIFSLFLAWGILYCWLSGWKKGWSWTRVVMLGFWIGLECITYFYAYGWILCSIFFFCTTCWKQEEKKSVFWLKTGTVAFTAFLVGGWFFIKNALFIPWDFLGFQATDLYQVTYAIEEIATKKPPAYYMSLWEMMFVHDPWRPWWLALLMSYILLFPMANVFPSRNMYIGLGIVYIPTFFTGLFCFFRNLFKEKGVEKLLYICLFLCWIIPFILVVYSNYQIDYQPQGRYLISNWPISVLMFTLGCQQLEAWIWPHLVKWMPFLEKIQPFYVAALGVIVLTSYVYLRLFFVLSPQFVPNTILPPF